MFPRVVHRPLCRSRVERRRLARQKPDRQKPRCQNLGPLVVDGVCAGWSTGGVSGCAWLVGATVVSVVVALGAAVSVGACGSVVADCSVGVATEVPGAGASGDTTEGDALSEALSQAATISRIATTTPSNKPVRMPNTLHHLYREVKAEMKALGCNLQCPRIRGTPSGGASWNGS